MSSCAGSCGFGSIKKKKSSYRPSVKRVKKAKKSKKSKSKSKFGSNKGKGKRRGSKKHSRRHKKMHQFGGKISIAQNYIGESPGQYENHFNEIPENLRSNDYN